MTRVFLGGTCNESIWRDLLIPMLKVGYFNPVVPDWTPACQAEELRQREACDYCLYTITPRMTGVYAIAEVVDDSNKRPARTVFCLLETDPTGGEKFTPGQLKSLNAVDRMIERNGGACFASLEDTAAYLNRSSTTEEGDALRVKGLIEGRIVHYVPENTEKAGAPGWHRAAIVNMTLRSSKGQEVWLTVFDPEKTYIVTSVSYDEKAEKPNTWHWIEGSNEALRQGSKE